MTLQKQFYLGCALGTNRRKLFLLWMIPNCVMCEHNMAHPTGKQQQCEFYISFLVQVQTFA